LNLTLFVPDDIHNRKIPVKKSIKEGYLRSGACEFQHDGTFFLQIPNEAAFAFFASSLWPLRY